MTLKSLSPALIEASEKMAKEYSIAVESLTQKQVAEAIRQAIEAGDFIRYVKEYPASQSVVYIPGMGMDRLNAENASLKSRIKTLDKFIVDHGMQVPEIEDSSDW